MSEVVVGLDIGSKRIGVAIGDTLVKIASPLDAVTNDQTTFSILRDLFLKHQSKVVVVGLPRNNDGLETRQSQYSRDFAISLDRYLKDHGLALTFVMQDESLTSVKAEKILRRQKGFKESMIKDGTLDSMAASLILSDYLESGQL